MRKQALLHLHGLLAEVRDDLEHRYDVDLQEYDGSGDLLRYDADDTRPVSVHRSKRDHRDAVLQLAGGIASALDELAGSDLEPGPGREPDGPPDGGTPTYEEWFEDDATEKGLGPGYRV